MNLLSIDLGTNAGFCFNKSEYGHFILKGQTGKKLIQFEQVIVQMFEKYEVTHVVFERPSWGKFTGTKFLTMLAGIIYKEAEKREITIGELSPKAIKKHVTGNGNADKKTMLKVIKEKYPHVVKPDTADAIAAYIYTEENLFKIFGE